MGARLRVDVVPDSRRTALERGPGGGFRIRVAPPAIDGRANKAVVAFLAELFDVSPSSVTILRGVSSRSKTIDVSGLTTEYAIERCEALLGDMKRPT